MKFPFRRRGAGRSRTGGEPSGENPFAAFDRATRPDDDADDDPVESPSQAGRDRANRSEPEAASETTPRALESDRIVAGEPRPRRRASVDPLRADRSQSDRSQKGRPQGDQLPTESSRVDPALERPRRRASARPSERAAAGLPPLTPRQRLRRIAVYSALFLLVMPAVPVTLLRYLPPPASAMMVKRWVDARSTGREFELRYDWVSHEKIARSLRAAVVASEDQRFYDHDGFDWKELRNAVDEWRDGSGLRGASTISQQVAKNLFLWPGRSFLRKGFEAWFTIWIEWIWPKKRILEVYLNIAEMGDGVFGAEAAARRYFRRPASGLTPSESALLAAALPSPLRSNPGNPSAYLRKRQKWILRQI